MTTMIAGLATPILGTLMFLLSQETATVEQDVVKAWDDLNRARAIQDRVALERTLAEEFLFIDPEGQIHSRAEYLGLAMQDESSITTIYGEEHRVRIYGDTAVLTGRVIVNRLESLGKEAPDPPIRVTAVFVMRDGRWQAATLQATRIGPSPKVAPGVSRAADTGSTLLPEDNPEAGHGKGTETRRSSPHSGVGEGCS